MRISLRLKQCLIALATVFYCFAAVFSWADDTDIYLHNPNLDNSIKPNVLFILDNSGSMRWDLDGNKKSSNPSRMKIMQDAFQDIMANSSGLNVGLMKLWARGEESSKLTFPITDIDQTMGRSPIILDGNPEIANSSDDGYEGSDGTVSLLSESIPLGGDNSGTGSGSSSGVRSFKITQFQDNAEGDVDWYYFVGNDSAANEMRFDNRARNRRNTLYFRNLDIPKNATIVSAKVRFRAFKDSTEAANIDIHAEVAKDPEDLMIPLGDRIASGLPFYLRTKTDEKVNWKPSNWQANEYYETPDLADLIQSLLGDARLNLREGESLDKLVLFFKSQLGRHISAHRISAEGANSENAAVLLLKYSTPDATDTYRSGLRFQTVGVPRGATITSATLDFTASASNDSETKLEIRVGRPGSTHNDPLTATKSNLSSRSTLDSFVQWSPGPWVQGSEESPNVYSVDVKTLVQNLVNDSSWCGNDPATFHIKPVSGNKGIRYAYSVDGSSASKPKLNIEYTGGEGGCQNEILNTRINAFTNDAYENNPGKIRQERDYLRIRKDSNTNIAGLHYPEIPIKKEATILEARLELTSEENKSLPTSLRIQAHNIGNSPAITPERRNLSGRPKTSYVDWTLSDWKKNQTYRSPDIKSVIQELVNRDDWQAGNNLTLLLSATAGYRKVISYDENPTLSPRLFIQVADGGIDADSTYKVKDHLIGLVKKIRPGGGTPITPVYLEAANYFKNGDGLTKPSPIQNSCQPNHIVLLTDGSANRNNFTTKDAIARLTENRNCSSDAYEDGEQCSRTLAEWLNETDLNSDMGSKQNIITHTIAFAQKDNATVQNFMSDLANKGGGKFYAAHDAAKLTSAFNKIITDIIEDESSFVSPGVTANQFNNSRHLSQVYYSVFKPAKSDRWQGNLKRYQLTSNPNIPNSPANLYDASSTPKLAVDPTTGFFKNDAFSFWSKSVDGRRVDTGGAGANLPAAADRKLFTYLGSNPAGTAETLNSTDHLLSSTNSEITLDHLGLAETESTRKTVLLDWARNPTSWYGDALHSVPALVTYGCSVEKKYCPEENQKLSIFFGTNTGFLHGVNAATGAEQFGFMPKELLPNLNKLEANAITNRSDSLKPYGIDGSPTLWVNDVNNNGVIYGGEDTLDYDSDGKTSDFLESEEVNTGEFVYAYVGMRRGGRSYYALDVTAPAAPKLLWFINNETAGFARLGQTWSKPVKTKIKVGGTDGSVIKDVLIFSGGYDPAQDGATMHQSDNMGNAIYIVDARTGALIWSAGNETDTTAKLKLKKMDYSIPGGVRVIDLQGDGIADQILFADVGGQVWRLYINNCTADNSDTCAVSSMSSIDNLIWPTDSDGDGAWTADEGVFANLGPYGTQMDDGTVQKTHSRRFYVEPDVSLFRLNGNIHFAVAIGSGNRPDPLGRVNQYVQDRAYVMAATSYSNPKVTASNVSEKAVPSHQLIKHDSANTQLADITNNYTATAQDNFGDSLATDRKGWYISMNTKEKVLTESVNFEGTLYFNTYLPSVTSSTSCNPVAGTARAYAVNLLTGQPVEEEDANGDGKPDRFITLANKGLPPSNTILFPEGSKGAVICVGAECRPLSTGEDKQTTYWRQIR